MKHGTLPEEWAEIQKIVLEALELSDAGRGALLEGLRSEDADKAAEVESLLRSLEEGPIGDPEEDLPWGGRHPERVGNYRIVRPLAEGGMGCVLLAVREGEGFDQVVALKLIRTDVFHPGIEARFEQERRILARLEHPAVARFIDGGMAPDGRPFVAMEYVRGEDLLTHCNQKYLSLEERIRLFCQVCDGVHFAHQQLVVHRDLKPSNILITEEGLPKLLDFGIAKLIEEEGAQAEGSTQTGLWMTPAFASPEQLRGDPLTTLSDVYTLGVLLYNLLTGKPPYETKGLILADVQRVVCEVDPPRPSSVVGAGHDPEDTAEIRAAVRDTTPDRLRRRLNGDLDTIVLKALAKDPVRRYGSASGLAEDLRRFLDGRPVAARPDSLGYRVAKFVGRNRTAVAAGVLVALSLGGGAAVASVQASRARTQAALAAEERTRAEEEAARARLVTGLMSEIFRLGDPAAVAGDTLTAREVLDRGTEEIRARLADEPAVQASLLLEVARIYRNLGALDRAQTMAGDAAGLYASVEPGGADFAAALGLQGELSLAQGRVDEGLDLMGRAARIREERAGPGDTLRATLFARMAWTRRSQGEHDDALRLFTEALEVQEEALGRGHPTTVNTRLGLAAVHHDLQSFDEAEALFRDLLEEGGTMEPRIETAEALVNLGMLRRLRQGYAEAEQLLRTGWEMRKALHHPDHPDLLDAADEYGTGLHELARYSEARAILSDAYSRTERTLGAGHELTVDVGETLAIVEGAMGAFDSAIPRYARIYEQKVALRGADHPGVISSLVRRAEIDLEAGHLDEAAALFDLVLEKTERESFYWALALGGMGRWSAIAGSERVGRSGLSLALVGAEEALAFLSSELRPEHRYVLDLRRVRAGLHMALGDAQSARNELEEILPSLRRLRPGPHPDIARTLVLLADARAALGDGPGSREALEEAAAHVEPLVPPHPLRTEIASKLGR